MQVSHAIRTDAPPHCHGCWLLNCVLIRSQMVPPLWPGGRGVHGFPKRISNFDNRAIFHFTSVHLKWARTREGGRVSDSDLYPHISLHGTTTTSLLPFNLIYCESFNWVFCFNFSSLICLLLSIEYGVLIFCESSCFVSIDVLHSVPMIVEMVVYDEEN